MWWKNKRILLWLIQERIHHLHILTKCDIWTAQWCKNILTIIFCKKIVYNLHLVTIFWHFKLLSGWNIYSNCETWRFCHFLFPNQQSCLPFKILSEIVINTLKVKNKCLCNNVCLGNLHSWIIQTLWNILVQIWRFITL